MTPLKPTDPRLRVFRGGAWVYTSAAVVRAAYRYDITPSIRANNVGVRCAQRGCRQPVGKVQP